MNDSNILNWIQTFGYCFRHGLNDDEYFLEWFDDYGHTHETSGRSLREAVIRAKLQADEIHYSN